MNMQSQFAKILLEEYRDSVLPKMTDEDLLKEESLLRYEWRNTYKLDDFQTAILQALNAEIKKRSMKK